MKNYYEILEVNRKATTEQIRTSFRKLALKHHPDKNSGSAESELVFRSLHEAYSILSSEEAKSRYDRYLDNSTVQKGFKKASLSRAGTGQVSIVEDLCSQLNYIFWEIEDIFTPGKNNIDLDIKKYSGNSLRRWLLTILIFIDRWVFTPSGYGDHFFQARLIDERQSYETISRGFNPFHHNPYMSFSGYFYKLRVRLDKFINRIQASDLKAELPGSQLQLIDSVYEALNMSYHYLGSIQMIITGNRDSVIPFVHRQGFSDREVSGLLN
jgi:curved DNA-binding protein CbpA